MVRKKEGREMHVLPGRNSVNDHEQGLAAETWAMPGQRT